MPSRAGRVPSTAATRRPACSPPGVSVRRAPRPAWRNARHRASGPGLCHLLANRVLNPTAPGLACTPLSPILASARSRSILRLRRRAPAHTSARSAEPASPGPLVSGRESRSAIPPGAAQDCRDGALSKVDVGQMDVQVEMRQGQPYAVATVVKPRGRSRQSALHHRWGRRASRPGRRGCAEATTAIRRCNKPASGETAVIDSTTRCWVRHACGGHAGLRGAGAAQADAVDHGVTAGSPSAQASSAS
jgi:hypothetical protein